MAEEESLTPMFDALDEKLAEVLITCESHCQLVKDSRQHDQIVQHLQSIISSKASSSRDEPFEQNCGSSKDSRSNRNHNNYKRADRMTDLMEAASVGDKQRLRKAVRRKDVNAIHAVDGKTALIYAVEGTYLTAVKDLLGAGADPNVINNAGRTALHYATLTNRTDVMKELLAAGANVNLPIGLFTPLHAAVDQGKRCLDAARLLIESGASANASCCETPFDIAMRKNSSSFVRLMNEQPKHS